MTTTAGEINSKCFHVTWVKRMIIVQPVLCPPCQLGRSPKWSIIRFSNLLSGHKNLHEKLVNYNPAGYQPNTCAHLPPPHHLPTVRASNKRCMVATSLTIPDSWTQRTNSSRCRCVRGSWNFLTWSSSCTSGFSFSVFTLRTRQGFF